MAPHSGNAAATTWSRKARLLAAGAAGILLAAVPAGAALADPKPFPGQQSTLTCAGQDFTVVLPPANGEWTPAFDTASNRVFQPIGFLETHYQLTAYDDAGAVAFEESGSEPGGAMKGGNRRGQAPVECTFETSFAGYDAEFGAYVEGSWGGTVLAVVRD